MQHSHRPIHHGHHAHHTPPPLLFPARRRLLANANSRIAPSASCTETSLRPCSAHAPPDTPRQRAGKQQTRISQTAPQDRKHTCAPERAADGAAPPATAPNGKPGGPGPMRQRSRPRITWRTAASPCALVSAPALSLCALYSSVFRRMTVAGRTVPRRPQTAPQRHSHASLVWQRPFRSVSRLRCALFALVVLFAALVLLWRCAVLCCSRAHRSLPRHSPSASVCARWAGRRLRSPRCLFWYLYIYRASFVLASHSLFPLSSCPRSLIAIVFFCHIASCYRCCN